MLQEEKLALIETNHGTYNSSPNKKGASHKPKTNQFRKKPSKVSGSTLIF